RRFTTTRPTSIQNKIYPTRARSESELSTLILSSSSTRIPLLTLFTTRWDADSPTISSNITALVESGTGEAQGGVSFVEVEFDAPDFQPPTGEIGMRFGINKIPTLLAFDRGEPQSLTKVDDLNKLRDREFLKRWIEIEAARHGDGGAG
ncbi:hypothetical protein K470DRAFT_196236, partial [Piedraia hortae CBS 480.64]